MDPHISRAPTLNINPSSTLLNSRDPLNKLFTKLFNVLPSSSRGHVVAVIGEFLGTIVFLVLAFAGVETASASSNKKQGPGVSTASNLHTPEQLLYIALAAGFSLAITAWTFFRISGGLFNPVISFGMALIGAITWVRCILLIVSQSVATIAASYIVYALFNGGLNVGTELGGGTSNAQGIVIEMILTAQLAFTIFMLAAEQHAATYLAPVGIGLSLFIGELVGVFWTGGSMNPIRSLAPCIVNRSFPDNLWIYFVGPIAGVILAVLIYKLVKALEYETAQDQDQGPDLILPMAMNVDARKPSSVIPVASVNSGPRSVEHSPAKTPELRVQQPSKTHTKSISFIDVPAPEKEEKAVLPECYAD